jgi:hypothetical protein
MRVAYRCRRETGASDSVAHGQKLESIIRTPPQLLLRASEVEDGIKIDLPALQTETFVDIVVRFVTGMVPGKVETGENSPAIRLLLPDVGFTTLSSMR